MAKGYIKMKNRDIKNKLSNYEANPPDKVWNAIANELDGDEQLILKGRLYYFEETPPDGIWNKISGQLTEKPVISFYQRFLTPIKYIAAALIISIAAWVILFCTNHKTVPKAAVQNAIIHSHKTIPATVYKPAANTTKKEATATNTGNNEYVNRYMLLRTQQGATLKISKKGYALFPTPHTTNTTNITHTAYKQLQSYMASVSVMPATDFAGMTELLKSLQENRQ